jgi:hypothetical protein
VVLKAIAPIVAPYILSKKFYSCLFQALFDELTLLPVEKLKSDKERTAAAVECLSELISNVSNSEYPLIQEEVVLFYERSKKRDYIEIYVDLIEYYCRNTQHDYSKHAYLFVGDVLMYMNDDDKTIVTKVITCLQSILSKLTTEAKYSLVPRIKDAIENISVLYTLDQE